MSVVLEEFQLMQWYAADNCMLIAAFDDLRTCEAL